jgi:hypothetical protein
MSNVAETDARRAKVTGALDVAAEMEKWPIRKVPDGGVGKANRAFFGGGVPGVIAQLRYEGTPFTRRMADLLEAIEIASRL